MTQLEMSQGYEESSSNIASLPNTNAGREASAAGSEHHKCFD